MAAWMMSLKDFLDRDRASFFLGIGAIVTTLAIGTCSTNGRISDLNTHIDGRLQDFGARIGDVNLNVSQLGERIQGLDDRVRDVEIAVAGLHQARGGGSPTVNQPSND